MPIYGGKIHRYISKKLKILDKILSWEEEWKKFASQLGLNFDYGSFWGLGRIKVNGVYRNHNMVLTTYNKGAGENEVIGTKLSVNTSNPKGIYIYICPEKFLNRIGKKLGKQDIQLRNYQFDKLYMIKGNNELETLKIIDYDIQSKILASKGFKTFEILINDNFVSLTVPMIICEVERLKSNLDIVIDIIEKLEN